MKLNSLFALFPTLASATNSLAPIHYPLTRRSGSFPAPDTANLTFLLSELDAVVSRFHATVLSFRSDSPVRKPRRLHGTQASTILLGDVGLEGSWFANLHIGEPAQEVDMDMDMLSMDWWVLSTRSGKGSFFLDFNSETYQDSKNALSFPTCREPTDIVHLPTIHRSIPILFAHCTPAKQWIRTLGPSGSHLGLAPGASLSQTKTKGLLMQLLESGMIDTSVFSLRVMNGKEGVLSVGGVSAVHWKRLGKDTDEYAEKQYLKRHHSPSRDQPLDAKDKEIKRQETRRGEALDRRMVIPSSYLKEENSATDWKWNKVRGPEGWWQMMMTGVWVSGRKVLQSQPIVLDINTPFILAPPLAARAFYTSISGSRRLPVPYDQFHAYPCFSPPQIQFEFGEEWKVHVLKGKRDKGTFSPGGRFSLGRMGIGSGYCVGIVVESRLGIRQAPQGDENGLEDVWILGEPFFGDCQVAFDWKEKKVGIQRI